MRKACLFKTVFLLAFTLLASCLSWTQTYDDANKTIVNVWGIDGRTAIKTVNGKTIDVGPYIYKIALDITNLKAKIATAEVATFFPAPASIDTGGRGILVMGTNVLYTYGFTGGNKAIGGRIYISDMNGKQPKNNVLFDAQAICGKCKALTFGAGIAVLSGRLGNIYLNAYEKPNSVYHFQRTMRVAAGWELAPDPKNPVSLQFANSGFDGLEMIQTNKMFVANRSDSRIALEKNKVGNGNLYDEYTLQGNAARQKLIDTTNFLDNKGRHREVPATGVVYYGPENIYFVSSYIVSSILIFDANGALITEVPLKLPRTWDSKVTPCAGLSKGSFCIEDLSLEEAD